MVSNYGVMRTQPQSIARDEAAVQQSYFQVREKHHSVKGIDNFLFLNPEMRTYFDEATTGGELLKAGNKERACSGS